MLKIGETNTRSNQNEIKSHFFLTFLLHYKKKSSYLQYSVMSKPALLN